MISREWFSMIKNCLLFCGFSSSCVISFIVWKLWEPQDGVRKSLITYNCSQQALVTSSPHHVAPMAFIQWKGLHGNQKSCGTEDSFWWPKTFHNWWHYHPSVGTISMGIFERVLTGMLHHLNSPKAPPKKGGESTVMEWHSGKLRSTITRLILIFNNF